MAVLFDLDDTLVPTSELDRAAIATAAELVAEPADSAETAARFRALLRAEPFPPPSAADAPAVALAGWRAWLWARAMAATDDAAAAARGGGAPPAAARRARRVVRARLAEFRLAPATRDARAARGEGRARRRDQRPGRRAAALKLAACDAAAVFAPAPAVSGEEPEPKPAASIFHAACARLGAPPGRTVMVGDSLAADVQGGSARLLATVWVRGEHGAAPPAGSPRPTHTIQQLAQLEGALDLIG